MFHRQRILLSLIEVFGGKLNNIDLQKYLFLFTKKCQIEKSYEFIPYKYGCFSFQSYADRRSLIALGLLLPGDDWTLAKGGHVKELKKEDQKKIALFKNKYGNVRGDELVKLVYREYPYYAIKSEIANRLMTDRELDSILENKPQEESQSFFTIGYEGNSFENYLNRLIKNNIKLLCDIRKNPLSRKYGFSRQTLSETLNKIGIEYIHIPELGINSEKRQELRYQSDYDKLFEEYEKTTLTQNAHHLEELSNLVHTYKRVAITCFEADHCMCHRSSVSKALARRPQWNCEILHI